MSRTMRQEGLVYQDKVSSLRVAVCGSHEILHQAVSSIASQLGIEDFPCDPESADHLLLLHDAVAPPSAEPKPSTRILLLHDGVRITGPEDLRGGSPSRLQLPGLSMAGASLAFQEVLRQHDCVRRVDVVKTHLTVQFRMDPRDLPAGTDPSGEFQIKGPDGSLIPLFCREWDDGTGHISLIGRMETDSESTAALLQNVELIDKGASLGEDEAVTAEIRIPRQTGDVRGTAVVVGAGGLGSWALICFSEGLENAGHSGSGIEVAILDPDVEIELHNLNRQVLYTEGDIGFPKAFAASAVIEAKLPYADIVSGVQSVGVPELELIREGVSEGLEDDCDPLDIGIEILALPPSSICDILSRANAVVSGVDNLRSRAILSAISARLGIPMINAGAAGWSGHMDVLRPDESCMVCRYGPGVARDARVASCQEDGEIPFSSIVTSTALFGALQGLALLAALSDDPKPLASWPGQIVWGGRANTVTMVNGPSKGAFHDAESSHESHLVAALFPVATHA